MDHDDGLRSLILVGGLIACAVVSLFVVSLMSVLFVARLGSNSGPVAVVAPTGDAVATITPLTRAQASIPPAREPIRFTAVAGDSATEQPSGSAPLPLRSSIPEPTLSLTPHLSFTPQASSQTTMPTPGSTIQPSMLASPVVAAPVPSSTPMRPMGDALTFLDDAFDDPASGWPVRQEPRWSAAYVDGAYRVKLEGQESASVSTAIDADDYVLQVDIAIEDGAAGIVFLSADPNIFYRLLLSQDGAFVIQRQQAGGVGIEIVPWQTSASLRHGRHATNTLRVERRGDVVAFFGNDVALTTFMVPSSSTTNRAGFVVTAPDGFGEASFDNLVVRYVWDTP